MDALCPPIILDWRQCVMYGTVESNNNTYHMASNRLFELILNQVRRETDKMIDLISVFKIVH